MDNILESFLETAKNNKIELPEDLLIQIYEIEKEYVHLDNDDRAAPFKAIEKAVEKYISSIKN